MVKASWSLVRQPNQTAEQYSQAVRLVQRARRLEPENAIFLNTLGVAQYRVGQNAEAVKTLTRCLELDSNPSGEPHPIHLAVLTMAHHRAGDHAVAQQLLERLRQAMKDDRWADYPDAKSFFAEAEAITKDAAP